VEGGENRSERKVREDQRDISGKIGRRRCHVEILVK
jgi:hypothetical protein